MYVTHDSALSVSIFAARTNRTQLVGDDGGPATREREWKNFLRRTKITRLESEYIIQHLFLEDILPSADSVIDKLNAFISGSKDFIVENHRGDKPLYDSSREFRLLNQNELLKGGGDDIKHWFQQVRNKIEGIFAIKDCKGKAICQNRFRFDATAIRSIPGCRQQDIHTDFPNQLDHQKVKSSKCFIAVLALQDGTKLVYLDRAKVLTTVCIPKGALFIANGLFLHGGAPYDVQNTRVHFYVYPLGCKLKKPKSTFFIDPTEVKLIPGELQRSTSSAFCYELHQARNSKRKLVYDKCANMRLAKWQRHNPEEGDVHEMAGIGEDTDCSNQVSMSSVNDFHASAKPFKYMTTCMSLLGACFSIAASIFLRTDGSDTFRCNSSTAY
jgi:hypothetical protein